MTSRLVESSETATRGGRQRRWGRKLAVGCLITAGAIVALGGPASAKYSYFTDESTASLTFVTFGGTTVTCQVHGFAEHETRDDPSSVLIRGTSRTTNTGGNEVPGCRAEHVITIRYRDGDDEETVKSYARATTNAQAEVVEAGHDVTDITITHEAFFNTCDPDHAICGVTTTTSPK
jgi:hypothetical protein